MNANFSLSRFVLLLKVQWVSSWKWLAVASVIVAGLLALALLYFEVYFDTYSYNPFKYQDVQQTVFNLGFILLSLWFCLHFYFLNWHGTKKTAFLRLPVSLFERTLLSFIWMTLGFVVWYVLLFYLVNTPMLKWANSYEYQSYLLSGQNVDVSPFKGFLPSKRMSFTGSGQLTILSPFILIQTLLLAALLWFKKSPVIKSITVVFLIALLYGWLQYYFMPSWLTPPSWIYDNYVIRVMKDPVFTEYNSISAASFWTAIHQNQTIILWLLMWGIIYYRIKEQEG